jgi:hypothetical protein
MGNKVPKDITKEDYQECCEAIKDFLSGQINELKLEDAKNDIIQKIDKKIKKATVFIFIKNYLEKEKKEKIINKMIDIFQSLFEEYDQIHRKDEDPVKTFSETADDNEKNIINAIYISKIFEDDIDEDAKIHDYAVYLYSENVVNEIEGGNNKNINEDFKNYDNLEIKEDEKNEKFKEICKIKSIDPDNYDKSESISSDKEKLNSQKDDKSSKKKT